MPRAQIIVGGLAALLIVAGTWRLHRPSGLTPEGDRLLVAVPNATSFAPRAMPGAPVLAGTAAETLSTGFGYRVGGIAYSYTLALRFPTGADAGEARVTARHAGKAATTGLPALRLFDPLRGAYVVAVKSRVDIEPRVPALCLQAVVGPDKTRFDLAEASLCVAQLDSAGACHPETLACAPMRARP